MRHLRTFENFDKAMIHSNEYPSVEEMMEFVCGCGYSEMELQGMSYAEICAMYNQCKMEKNESRRYSRYRRHENFDHGMMNHNRPSEEEMMDYLCSCGYNEMDVMEMDFHELCNAYEECRMETNEARKYKRKPKSPTKKSRPVMPDFPDVDGDGDKDEPISKANRDKKAAQGGRKTQSQAQKKTQSQAQGKLSAGQRKLPAPLQKAIANKKK